MSCFRPYTQCCIVIVGQKKEERGVEGSNEAKAARRMILVFEDRRPIIGPLGPLACWDHSVPAFWMIWIAHGGWADCAVRFALQRHAPTPTWNSAYKASAAVSVLQKWVDSLKNRFCHSQ